MRFLPQKNAKTLHFCTFYPKKSIKKSLFNAKKLEKCTFFVSYGTVTTFITELLPELNFDPLYLFQFPNTLIYLHFADGYFHYANIIKLLF